MKINADKSHLLLSGNTQLTSDIDNNLITSEKEQMLLGTTIDSNLSFEEHFNNLCKKASQKLNALARILRSDTASQITPLSRECFFTPLRRTIKNSGRSGNGREDRLEQSEKEIRICKC